MSESMDHRRPEAYPADAPDFEGDLVFPAPDGRPWRKACAECAFRTNDPQGLGLGYADEVRYRHGDTVFYCVHRTDGEEQHHRICACFAACKAGEAFQKGDPRA